MAAVDGGLQAEYGVKVPDDKIYVPGGAQPMYGIKDPIDDLPPNLIQPLYGVKPDPGRDYLMANGTHTRSVGGAAILKNEFNASIEALIKILNGAKYTDFKKTISANWVGADATDFLNDVEKTRAELEKNLRALKTKFNAAVDADAKQFGNFQSKNVK